MKPIAQQRRQHHTGVPARAFTAGLSVLLVLSVLVMRKAYVTTRNERLSGIGTELSENAGAPGAAPRSGEAVKEEPLSEEEVWIPDAEVPLAAFGQTSSFRMLADSLELKAAEVIEASETAVFDRQEVERCRRELEQFVISELLPCGDEAVDAVMMLVISDAQTARGRRDLNRVHIAALIDTAVTEAVAKTGE